MATFIYTPKGYLNLSKVAEARFRNDERFLIVVDGAVMDDNHVGFPRTITSIIPTQGEWECLYPFDEEDKSKSILSEPVLAWGLTVLGEIVPITPSARDGVFESFGLRKAGDTRIYERSVGGYDDITEWLKLRSK